MKRLLVTLALGSAAWLLTPGAAQAQVTDSTNTAKPQLNTLPPAPRPATPTPRSVEPEPVAPAPAPAPVPPTNQDFPRPSPDSPSGLNFPEQPAVPPTIRHWFLYSNFGLGFNSVDGVGQFNFSLAPALGYRLTDRLAVGPGVSYSYTSYSFSQFLQGRGYPKSLKANNLGVKVFSQFILLPDPGIFIHGEYEVTRVQYPTFDVINGRYVTRKSTVTTPLLGLGYRQKLGDRAAGDIVLLYNFNDGLDDIYGQPVIRFSFLFDLK